MLSWALWAGIATVLLASVALLRGGRPTGRALAVAAALALLGSLPATSLALTWHLGGLGRWELAVGGLLCLGQFVFALRHLRQPFAHAEPVRDPVLLAALARLAAAAGLDRAPDLLRQRTLGVLPAYAWVVRPQRPAVVIADGLVHRLDPPEVEAVLAHEVAHIASRSLAWLVLPAPLSAAAAVALAPWIGACGTLALAWALGAVGRRLVSRPTELICDRRAAALTSPAAMATALRRMHAVHPMRDGGWREALAWGLSSHPHVEQRAFALGHGDAHAAARLGRASRWALALWGIAAGLALGLALAGGPAADLAATSAWVLLALCLSLSARLATRGARAKARRLAPNLHPGRHATALGWAIVALGFVLMVGDRSAIGGLLAVLAGFSLAALGRWQARGVAALRRRLAERLQRLDLPGAFALGLDHAEVLRRDPATRFDWALVALASGERASGMEALEDLALRAPRLLVAPLSLGAALLEERPERSLELGRTVAERAPGLPEGPVLEVRALRRLGRGAEARATWERARARDPEDAGVLVQAVELALDRGDPAEAATWQARAQRRCPGDLGLSLAAARLALAEGALDLARTLLDRAESLHADHPFTFLGWRVAELAGLLEEADPPREAPSRGDRIADVSAVP